MSSEGSDVDYYYDDDDDMAVDDEGKPPHCSPHARSSHSNESRAGSAISEDDMDAMDTYRDDYSVQPSSSKRKSYEVDFDTLPQEAVEELIRKDVEYISSIFGVEVCLCSIVANIVLY